MPRCLRQFARSGRGSLIELPCPSNELARIVRATLRAFPTCPRRGKRGPEDQSQEQRRAAPLLFSLLRRAGARCFSLFRVPIALRRQRSETPAGAARGIAQIPLSAQGCAVNGTRLL